VERRDALRVGRGRRRDEHDREQERRGSGHAGFQGTASATSSPAAT
jgi:hypothetical protein